MRGTYMRRRNIIGIIFMAGCLMVGGCTKDNDNGDVTREQPSETVTAETATEIETIQQGGVHGIESSFNIEEMNRIREEYSYIFDALELPENVIFTSIKAAESDDGEVCIVFTVVDDDVDGKNDVSNYGRVVRYRDNDGTPEMSVAVLPYQMSKSRISAMYYNNGVCVIGTTNGAGNLLGKVTIYRQYHDNSAYDEFTIDCNEYGVSEDNPAYADAIYVENGETYCEVVTANGDKAAFKLPFVGDMMRTVEECVADALGCGTMIHDGAWIDNVAMYRTDFDGDGIDEYVLSSDEYCYGIVRSDNYENVNILLVDYLRSDDYFSDVSVSVRDSDDASFKYMVFTLTGVNGESYEKEAFVPAEYVENYSGTSLGFSYKPIYDEFDGTLSFAINIEAAYGANDSGTVIDTVHTFAGYTEKYQGITLSGQYVLGPFDTRTMPDVNMRLDDCEVMTGTRDELKAFIGTPKSMEAYHDWEMFLIRIDNHWRVGYYKDGTAVIVYYNSGCYEHSESGESYEGKVCIVAQADRDGGFKFGGWQLERLGTDIVDGGTMSLTDIDGDGEDELLVGSLTDDVIDSVRWYNEIKLKK